MPAAASLVPAMLVLLLAATTVHGDERVADTAAPTLGAAGPLEQATLERLLEGGAWPRRAVAALRLARYRCAASRTLLDTLLEDRVWQVRNFAIIALATRGDPLDTAWAEQQEHPRVVRTALRAGARIAPERLARGVENLRRSERLDQLMLAAELASNERSLHEEARECVKKITLRMDRAQAGLFGPRLTTITGAAHRSRLRWREWCHRNASHLPLRAASLDRAPSPIARLAPETFATLETYMEELEHRSVDLALCIDTTASMSGELAAAQGGMNDLILFVGDVVGELRVGLVAYRDRRDRFQTKAWDLTADRVGIMRHLWTLEADGGGDSRESVFEALRLAGNELSWDREHTMILVLLGDAPPHVGRGQHCVEMAGRGAAAGLTTHVIRAKGREVEFFGEIAEAGGGRCVDLEEDDRLIPEIAGLTLGERFEEEFGDFFRRFLETCR